VRGAPAFAFLVPHRAPERQRHTRCCVLRCRLAVTYVKYINDINYLASECAPFAGSGAASVPLHACKIIRLFYQGVSCVGRVMHRQAAGDGTRNIAANAPYVAVRHAGGWMRTGCRQRHRLGRWQPLQQQGLDVFNCHQNMHKPKPRPSCGNYLHTVTTSYPNCDSNNESRYCGFTDPVAKPIQLHVLSWCDPFFAIRDRHMLSGKIEKCRRECLGLPSIKASSPPVPVPFRPFTPWPGTCSLGPHQCRIHAWKSIKLQR